MYSHLRVSCRKSANCSLRSHVVSASFSSRSRWRKNSLISGRGILVVTAGCGLLGLLSVSDGSRHFDGGSNNSKARNLVMAESSQPQDNTGFFQHKGSSASEPGSVDPNVWSNLSNTVAKVIVPDWAKAIPAFIEKLQRELTMQPGTLAFEMMDEANDPEANPEIIWEASVRVSNDLCKEEKSFLQARKTRTARALARYLDVSEDEVDPEDVPIIAMCGSGGGLRALVAGASSYAAAAKAGLFDCVTYTAGVSGSCWLQALYYSSLGGQRHESIIKHLKNRIGVHIAYPPPLLRLVTSAPTNKFLLCGGFEKYQVAMDSNFGLVDIYGLLLGARLLVPKGELGIDSVDLKVSNQRRYVDDGSNPLPIYTSVRHEIPADIAAATATEAQEKIRKDSWFQWFEETPYEFWCEEYQAGIPTWAVGRKFSRGRTIFRENGLAVPEIRLPILMGIWGSAFCATLSHYYREIRPVLLGIGSFDGLDKLINERDDDLIKVHPVEPGQIPNCFLEMRDMLPETAPESIHASPYISLMDAGMSNNLPIYPLLRPGRNVDILIVFDASADVKKDNWLKVAEGYARQRQIKGWPIGTGWPDSDRDLRNTVKTLDDADGTSVEEAEAKINNLEQKYDRRMNRKDAPNVEKSSTSQSVPKKDLGYCNIWVGTTSERNINSEPPPSPLLTTSKDDWLLMEPDAGLAVIYFPFLPNPTKVEGVDPMKSDYLSTWNFVYTPEQIDKVAELATVNFAEGEEVTKRTVRAVWERKRAQRLERMQQHGIERSHMSNQGDHFS